MGDGKEDFEFKTPTKLVCQKSVADGRYIYRHVREDNRGGVYGTYTCSVCDKYGLKNFFIQTWNEQGYIVCNDCLRDKIKNNCSEKMLRKFLSLVL